MQKLGEPNKVPEAKIKRTQIFKIESKYKLSNLIQGKMDDLDIRAKIKDGDECLLRR